MFEIYDVLINAIPGDLTVKNVAAGYFWTCVQSDIGTGSAVSASMSYARPFIDKSCLIGKSLREVAKGAKSWNLIEATIGMAAINAYYNTPDVAQKNGVRILGKNEKEDRLNDPYIAYQNAVRGKKVAGLGHADYLSTLMGSICDLTLIGDDGSGGYPFDAADFLLPQQDYVYLPCTAFATKHIQHWLDLSRNSRVIICGPSLPMAPALFDFGIYDLSGFIVRNEALALRIAASGENESFFASGEKVSLRADL